MSIRRESKQPVPSVMAKLMGLNEVPSQQPVLKRPRVLSESYYNRVGSIGVRERVGSIGVREKCRGRNSFRLRVENDDEDEDDGKNIFRVLESLRGNTCRISGCTKLNEMSNVCLQLGYVAAFKSSHASDSRDISMSRNFRRKSEHVFLNSPKKVQSNNGVYSPREHGVDDRNKSGKSNLNLNYGTCSKPTLRQTDSAAGRFSLSPHFQDTNSEYRKKREILASPAENMNLKLKGRKKNAISDQPAIRRSRFARHRTKNVSHGTTSMHNNSEIICNDNIGKESRSTTPPSILSDRNRQYSPNGSRMTRESKKQISERWRTSKRFQQVEMTSRNKILCELVGVLKSDESSPINQGGSDKRDVNSGSPLSISSWRGGKNPFSRHLAVSKSLLAHFNAAGNSNTTTTSEPLENRGYTRGIKSIDFVKDKTTKEDLSQKGDAAFINPNNPLLAEEKVSSCTIQDASDHQGMSNETFEDESVASQFSWTDPDSLISAEENYHSSPNSVLEPIYRDISSISHCFKSLDAASHDINFQLELLQSDELKSYSEASSLMVSSDEDVREEGSVNDYEAKADILSLFRVEESRDFSYLVDVLAEAGLQNINMNADFNTWHSEESPISNSVFESLEKKYGEQISWKISERKLLFDRINSSLLQILQSYANVLTWRKPVAKRLRSSEEQELIEEELWTLLVNQEKDASKESEKFFGKDDGWLELDIDEDVQNIGREIENSLIDELVAVVSMDCF